MLDRNQIVLIIFDLLLAGLICILLLAIGIYPGLKVAFATLIAGCVVILFYTFYKLYQKNAQRAVLEKKQLYNIVPGQCPDYWTRTIVGDKLMCKNEFITSDGRGNTTKYSFTGKQVPSLVTLNDVAALDNTKKCDAFGSPVAFGAPWVEMQQKCQTLNVAYEIGN